ncbi:MULTISPECIES: alpha/beta hydrolase [Streptomyces]|uniref:Alpha/beta hydrolase n=1 Tax=Streptomyces koelreuteriae TaxID=2838015 RepID=A0ABX8FPY0_9ACTN|nr:MULTISPECIES: alpha/beta hydrolase [Streptomyces]QWB23209.1 alpha/beta hydrolase [Streptomyces koelreuteriae]UUA06160.1 alpha/beta hydrolase [Streptomyces koelreuteriae]UUA13788.1 alpha/beta hydrolase [Streptomyces sp. CRCS-T-1]
MSRFVRWTAVAVASALLAAGCGGGSSDDDKGGGGLSWGRCKATADAPAPGNDWQCATLKVPLDWSKPDGETIGLALIRAKARGDDRVGSLLFNFGGPGASGLSMMPSYAPTVSRLRERYDLVSWDPRGVGASEGVRCRGDKEIQAAESVDVTPDTPAEEKAYFQDAADFGEGCQKDAGKLMAHVSTADSARDMDRIRDVLGDDRMHYFGISYGTELGGTYAHLFPRRVGRMTLDAVVDPDADTVGHAQNQARGFQRALNGYLESTGQDPEEGTRKIAALLRRIDARPLPTATPGRKLTETLAVTGLTLPLYNKESWPTLTSALDAAERGDGSELLTLADGYNDRAPSGHYGTTTHSQRVISCLDDRQRPTAARTKELLPEFEKISPVFGPFLGWDTAGWCHDWPVPGQHDTPEVSAPEAAPILVVGNTGDPATPYEGARKMSGELGKGVGVLLTWRGQGHGAYGSGSDCVDSTVNSYLLNGSIPKDGKVCS